MSWAHFLLQRGMRYDDHVGGGGIGETLAFCVFVGFCWLVVSAFSNWDSKVEKRKDAEREKERAAKSKHFEEVEWPRRKAVLQRQLEKYGATPEERRKAIEKEAMTYVANFENETGFEKDVAFCYLSFFLYKYENREKPRPPSTWRSEFLKHHCPEGVQWHDDNSFFHPQREKMWSESEALKAAEKEAEWRFSYRDKHTLSSSHMFPD